MAGRTLRRLDRASLEDFRRRLETIDPAAEPRFGTLRPHQMFAHLAYLIELSLGEREAEHDVSTAITRSRLFWIVVVDWMPWPKGKLKAPQEFTPEPSGSFEEERGRLLAAMERFVAALESTPRRVARSPLTGPLPLTDWSRLHGKHLCHHLAQFGAL